MQVGEIMHTDVKTANADDTFADVAKTMRLHGISSVVILDGKKLAGILTERDVVNPVESSITGMTRDGTFLIERGEVVGPVMNFRFTQSILEALSDVSMVGREPELASEFFFSAACVPALKIERFHFSGRSDH